MPTEPSSDDNPQPDPQRDPQRDGGGGGGNADGSPGARGDRPDPAMEAVLEVIRRLELDLEQLRRELAWSQRLATLGSLAAVIAHEVNNTLTPVSSYAQLALASPEDEALRAKALTMAVDGVERAARIASSVLGMVQDAPGSPGTPGSPGNTVDNSEFIGTDNKTRAPSGAGAGGGGATSGGACCLLRDTVDAALACLARDPAKDGIAVTLDLPDVAVSIPRGDLQQVLVNLLLNARKALMKTSGARRLSLTARMVEGAQDDDAADPASEPRTPQTSDTPRAARRPRTSEDAPTHETTRATDDAADDDGHVQGPGYRGRFTPTDGNTHHDPTRRDKTDITSDTNDGDRSRGSKRGDADAPRGRHAGGVAGDGDDNGRRGGGAAGPGGPGTHGVRCIELVVADTGPGIPAAMRGRLFNAFATCPIQPTPAPGSAPASGSTTGDADGGRGEDESLGLPGPAEREHGTGLGLSICRDLLARVGGTITADPAPERGAVFRLRLPLAA